MVYCCTRLLFSHLVAEHCDRLRVRVRCTVNLRARNLVTRNLALCTVVYLFRTSWFVVAVGCACMTEYSLMCCARSNVAALLRETHAYQTPCTAVQLQNLALNVFHDLHSMIAAVGLRCVRLPTRTLPTNLLLQPSAIDNIATSEWS